MDRFSIQTSITKPTEISNSNLFIFDNLPDNKDKRTYFHSISAKCAFKLIIHGKEFNSKKVVSPICQEGDIEEADTDDIDNNIINIIDNYIVLANDIGSITNYVELISSKDLRNDVAGTSLDQQWLKFLVSKNDIKLTVDIDTEYAYTYVIDNKTIKRKKKNYDSNEIDEKKQADIEESKKQWIAQQTKLSKKIWDEVQKSFDNDDFNKLDSFTQLKQFQNKYQRFNKQHPICLRYMLDHRKYNMRAFAKYMNKVANSKGGDENEYLERQADYAVYVYKETTPKWSSQHCKMIYENTYAIIKRESDVFKSVQDSSEKIANMIDEKQLHELRGELQEKIEILRRTEDPEELIIKTNRELRLIDAINKHHSGEQSSDEDEEDWEKYVIE